MSQKLSHKVAVVTGAGSKSGIGKEVAKAMAAEGAKVVVNAATFSRPLKEFDKLGFGLGDGMPVTPVRDPEYVAPIVVYLATDKAKDMSGQFIYSSGGGICIYARPFQLPGPHMFIRKDGKWSIDELDKVLLTLIK